MRLTTKGIYDVSNKELKEEFARIISEWHDKVKPKYIFLTETSATPWGYLIKGAWKKAYPGEQLPRFYRIDPRSLSRGSPVLEQIPKYLSERIKDKKANIIVFDESGSTGASTRRVINWLDFPEGQTYVYRGLMTLEHGTTGTEYPLSELDLGQRGLGVHPAKKVTKKTTGQRGEPSGDFEYRLTGRMIKDSSKRKQALKYISRLKNAGQEVGRIIKRTDLEHKVTLAIAIGILMISILFMSNNITGDAIVVNSTTSNWAGGILFIIGLIVSLIYYKRR